MNSQTKVYYSNWNIFHATTFLYFILALFHISPLQVLSRTSFFFTCAKKKNTVKDARWWILQLSVSFISFTRIIVVGCNKIACFPSCHCDVSLRIWYPTMTFYLFVFPRFFSSRDTYYSLLFVFFFFHIRI